MKSIYVINGYGIKCGSVVEFTFRCVITTQDLVDDIELLEVIQDKLAFEGIDPNFLLELNIDLISVEEL